MSQCFNPNCLNRNPANTKFCQKCGKKLLLGDRYRAINYIGQGGFGRTFKAIDEKRLNTLCVIKQFWPQQQSNSAIKKAEKLFKQEAERLRDLGSHPQIPELLSFEKQDGRFYLVQQFIDGQDLLKELHQKGKFSEVKISQILDNLLPVLEFCHGQNVIHRDIKPENIIRAKNGTLVLIDFGVSKQLTATIINRLGTVTGSPGYAAPEQMQGKVFPASDLYSLAVTCIRLLTGCLPVRSPVSQITLGSQETPPTPLVSGATDELFNPMQMEWVWREKVTVSDELGKILDKMLSFKVGDRYQSAAAVLLALSPPSAASTIFLAPQTISGSPNFAHPAAISKSNHGETFYYKVVRLDRHGNISSRNSASNRGYIEPIDGIELPMANIPSGSFLMGSPDSEAEHSKYEKPQHFVSVPEFFMGRTQVTQAQWRAVAMLPKISLDLDPEPSQFKGDLRPVERVSWYECIEFCARLSQKTGKHYRLPSEAEWEYACRAGTTTPFHFGETISSELANYDGNYIYGQGKTGVYRGETTAVGSLNVANSWGLYDMHGNVWEWCLDDWHESYNGAPTDGRPWLNDGENYDSANVWLAWLKKILGHKNSKVLRGGFWYSSPGYCRSALRLYLSPGYRSPVRGFRIAVSRSS